MRIFSCTSVFILIFINPQYTVLHILSHCTSYSLFNFIICSYFHSHLYLYIFSCVMFHCFLYYFFISFYFFALSIERTCPDLHFTTDYTLYDCVCETNNKEPWGLRLSQLCHSLMIQFDPWFISYFNLFLTLIIRWLQKAWNRVHELLLQNV